MAPVDLVRVMPGTVADVFAVVADLRAFGDYLPMTRVSHDPEPIEVGWSFTGYTGLGPASLPDRMHVTSWEPPHRFAVVKDGPVLDGWAQVDLSPVEGGPAPATRVRWREEIVLRPTWLGRLMAAPTQLVNRWLFGTALAAMHARLSTHDGAPEG